MAVTYRVLGQALPSPNVFFDMYAVPSTANAIISTLNVCNQSAANVTFRVAIRPANATITGKNYIVYDTALPAQDSIALSLGMSLASTDVITVLSYQGNVSFSAFGTEIS
jgi:hypothetical protein